MAATPDRVSLFNEAREAATAIGSGAGAVLNIAGAARDVWQEPSFRTVTTFVETATKNTDDVDAHLQLDAAADVRRATIGRRTKPAIPADEYAAGDLSPVMFTHGLPGDTQNSPVVKIDWLNRRLSIHSETYLKAPATADAALLALLAATLGVLGLPCKEEGE